MYMELLRKSEGFLQLLAPSSFMTLSRNLESGAMAKLKGGFSLTHIIGGRHFFNT